MAKKVKDWKGVLMDVIKGELLTKLKDSIQNAVEVTRKKIMRAITSSILMLLGILFLIVGGTFYLTDILKYSRSTVYLVVGLILILISIILAQSAKLLKY